MAKSGKPTRALMENVITLLCHSDQYGKLVAALVDPNLFEGDYSIIAGLAVDYWQRYGKAPKQHTADLVADILDEGGARARIYEEIIRSMVELSDQVNTAYVIDQLRSLVRVQKIKQAITLSAERINAQQEMAVEEVEQIWAELARVRETHFDRGMSLSEIDRVLDYISNKQSEFPLGIPELDRAYVGPARGEVLLLLGATGMGKTWFLIHASRMALRQGKRVLHISLEMSEEQVAQRYYQTLFGASKRDREIEITEIETNALDKIEKIVKSTVKSEFTFDSPMVRDELEVRLNTIGARVLDNLIIKRFASLTMDQLEAYLDNLEVTENWIPDMIGLDYWGLVDHGGSVKEHRLSMGQAFKRFRSIMVDRHIAGITPQQASKQGAKAETVMASHVAEDWSLTNTADMILTYSATDSERQIGLGRLYVSKARDEKDKFGVLLTQNYNTGQFVLQSYFLGPEYKALMPRPDKPEKPDDDEED